MNKLSPDILKTKSHFEVLDGLRGVAAVAIVIFHFMEWAYPDFSKNIRGHGFLAVDFFFCLSGFVIGYAYDDRMQKMGIIEFLKSRLIRLHPLIILGAILGLAGFIFDPFGPPPETYDVSRIFLLFLSSIFLIPFPAMEERAINLILLKAHEWTHLRQNAEHLV